MTDLYKGEGYWMGVMKLDDKDTTIRDGERMCFSLIIIDVIISYYPLVL